MEREKDNVCGSCTEPLVSHMLSKRLSREPGAWSEDGLKKMAMLRVYTQNAGFVEAADIRIARKTQARREELAEFAKGFKKYNDYAEKQIQEILDKKHDWSIFERHSAAADAYSGKLTGTAVLLKACGRISSAVGY